MKKPLFALLICYSSVMLAQQPLPYSQNFEDTTFPPTNWEFFGSNTAASWERSTTVGAYGNSTACMFFDNFTNNVSGNYYGIRIAPVDLTNAVAPFLKFDVAYARKNSTNSDRLGIWYSFNGSTGWQNITNYENNALTTAEDNSNLFTPTKGEWRTITLDLKQFAGDPYLRLAFENNSKNGNVMYIDNVHVYDTTVATGINEQHQKNQILVSPTLVMDGIINIHSDVQAISNIEIFSINGQLMNKLYLPNEFKSYTIHVNTLENGIYLLKIQTADAMLIIEKFIVQRQ